MAVRRQHRTRTSSPLFMDRSNFLTAMFSWYFMRLWWLVPLCMSLADDPLVTSLGEPPEAAPAFGSTASCLPFDAS